MKKQNQVETSAAFIAAKEIKQTTTSTLPARARSAHPVGQTANVSFHTHKKKKFELNFCVDVVRGARCSSESELHIIFCFVFRSIASDPMAEERRNAAKMVADALPLVFVSGIVRAELQMKMSWFSTAKDNIYLLCALARQIERERERVNARARVCMMVWSYHRWVLGGPWLLHDSVEWSLEWNLNGTSRFLRAFDGMETWTDFKENAFDFDIFALQRRNNMKFINSAFSLISRKGPN